MRKCSNLYPWNTSNAVPPRISLSTKCRFRYAWAKLFSKIRMPVTLNFLYRTEVVKQHHQPTQICESNHSDFEVWITRTNAVTAAQLLYIYLYLEALQTKVMAPPAVGEGEKGKNQGNVAPSSDIFDNPEVRTIKISSIWIVAPDHLEGKCRNCTLETFLLVYQTYILWVTVRSCWS